MGIKSKILHILRNGIIFSILLFLLPLAVYADDDHSIEFVVEDSLFQTIVSDTGDITGVSHKIESLDFKTYYFRIRSIVADDYEGIWSDTLSFNIILSEASEEDTRLSRAIWQHAKVVLPVYIDPQLNVSGPEEAFSPAAIGHVHLEQGIDGFVKEVCHTVSYQSYSIPSFASALNAVINNGEIPQPVFEKTFRN